MSDEALTQAEKKPWHFEWLNGRVLLLLAVLTFAVSLVAGWGNAQRHNALQDHQVADHETRLTKTETEQRLQAEYLIRMDGKIDRIGDRLGLDLRRKPFSH